MKVKVNIRDHLGASEHIAGFTLSRVVLDLDDFFECNDIPETQDIDVDIHELLAENRQIAHVWGTDDVRQLRPDLDDDQAWAVLQLVEEKLEQDVGISREMVERIAEVLYPDKPERHWQGRIDVSVENYTRDAAIEHFEAMAETIERQSVNSTMRAVFDPASLRLAGHDETTNR